MPSLILWKGGAYSDLKLEFRLLTPNFINHLRFEFFGVARVCVYKRYDYIAESRHGLVIFIFNKDNNLSLPVNTFGPFY